MMNILVIDGQGGNIGRQLVKLICERIPGVNVTAVGTNSTATSNMLKGGDVSGATGENAVVVGCRRADVIVGPMGIVVADSLLGEVSPKMATAVGQSKALRVLIPMSKCDTVVAGVSDSPVSVLIEDAVGKIAAFIKKTS